jgi:hypothetical protein
MCDFPETCDGVGFVQCRGCGGDQCVCGPCFGHGEAECSGCPECPRDELDDNPGPDDEETTVSEPKMTKEEWDLTMSLVMTFGALVRELPLEAFLEASNTALAAGSVFAPAHWIASHEKLELVVKLAEKLRAFQAVLPSEEEAKAVDERAGHARERLGL